MRWSEAGCLSQFVLAHALRQPSVSLILDVRHKDTISPKIQAERRRRYSNHQPADILRGAEKEIFRTVSLKNRYSISLRIIR